MRHRFHPGTLCVRPWTSPWCRTECLLFACDDLQMGRIVNRLAVQLERLRRPIEDQSTHRQVEHHTVEHVPQEVGPGGKNVAYRLIDRTENDRNDEDARRNEQQPALALALKQMV